MQWFKIDDKNLRSRNPRDSRYMQPEDLINQQILIQINWVEAKLSEKGVWKKIKLKVFKLISESLNNEIKFYVILR